MQKTERKFHRDQRVQVIATGKFEVVGHCHGRGYYEVAPHRDSPDREFRTLHARALRAA